VFLVCYRALPFTMYSWKLKPLYSLIIILCFTRVSLRCCFSCVRQKVNEKKIITIQCIININMSYFIIHKRTMYKCKNRKKMPNLNRCYKEAVLVPKFDRKNMLSYFLFTLALAGRRNIIFHRSQLVHLDYILDFEFFFQTDYVCVGKFSNFARRWRFQIH